MRFKLQNSGDNWSFELLSDADSSILKSSNFSSRDAAVQGIRDSISAMREAANYNSNPNGTYSLVSNGNTLATSTNDAPSADNLRQDALNTTDFPVDFTTTTTTTTTTRRRLNKELPKPPSLEEMAVLYVISRQSTSGQAGPELIEDADKYWWHFNNANGNAIIYGRGFDSASKRKANIRTALRYGTKIKYYELLEENGKYYFVLRTPNGFEIVRSAMFDSAEERQAGIDYFIAHADAYKADYAKATRKQKLNAQEYVFDYPSSSGEAGFEIFKNPDNKKHYFHLNDAEGKALMYSQGYRGGKPRDTGMRSVIKNGNIRERYRIKERDGKFYTVLLAGNNQEIARSKPLNSKAEAEQIITYVFGVMPGYANEYGVELVSTTQTSTATDTFNIAMDVPAPAPAKPKKKTDDYMACSAYKSEPGTAGFRQFQNEKDGEFYFSYNDEQGNTIWRSEGYKSAAARDNGIASVEKNAPIEGRISIHKTKSGKTFAKIKAGNNQEIARSCYHEDEKELALLLAPFMQDHDMDANVLLGGMFAGWAGYRSDWGWWKQKEEEETRLAFAAKAEEEARLAAEAEAKAKAEEEARLAAEAEAKAKAEKEARLAAEAEAKAKAEKERLALAAKAEEESKAKAAAAAAAAAALAAANAAKAKKEEEERLALAAKAEEDARIKAAAEAERLRKIEERKKKLDVDNYLPCQDYKIGRGYREFKQNSQYYFTYNDNDGNVILRSEGYNKPAARNKGRDWVKRQMKDRKNFIEKHTAAGKYYFVLMANEKTEIARSCYYDDKAAMLAALGGLFPVAAAVPTAAAGAAVAAAAAGVAATTPKKPAVAAATTPPPVTQTRSGGGWWKWLLPLLLLLLLLLFLWKGCAGCNGCGSKAIVPPVVTDTINTNATSAADQARADSLAALQAAADAKAKAEAEARSAAAAAAREGNPLFNTSNCNNPKELTRLGTNPEFGNCSNLDEAGFYNRLKKAHANSSRDKRFLDNLFKGLGYAGGFADITPNMVSSVTIPRGTVGNMGSGAMHKSTCARLNATGKDLDAFRISGIDGYSINFMKTCGNHFFIKR